MPSPARECVLEGIPLRVREALHGHVVVGWERPGAAQRLLRSDHREVVGLVWDLGDWHPVKGIDAWRSPRLEVGPDRSRVSIRVRTHLESSSVVNRLAELRVETHRLHDRSRRAHRRSSSSTSEDLLDVETLLRLCRELLEKLLGDRHAATGLSKVLRHRPAARSASTSASHATTASLLSSRRPSRTSRRHRASTASPLAPEPQTPRPSVEDPGQFGGAARPPPARCSSHRPQEGDSAPQAGRALLGRHTDGGRPRRPGPQTCRCAQLLGGRRRVPRHRA